MNGRLVSTPAIFSCWRIFLSLATGLLASPVHADEPTIPPRVYLAAVKHAVWLEDYAAAQVAIRELKKATTPSEQRFLEPYLQPFKWAAAPDIAEVNQGLAAIRERAERKLPPNVADPAAKVYLAMLLLRAGREDEALAVAEALPDHEQRHYWMYRLMKAQLLARLYAERRDWNRALAALQMGLRLLPAVEEDTKYYDNPPGIVDAFRNRIAQVDDLYLRQVDPARWLYKQHIIAVMAGDRQLQAQVQQHYQSLLAEYPRSYWTGRAVYENALRMWQLGKESDAAALWQGMLTSDPRGPWRGHALLALADYRLGVQLDAASALPLYRQAWEGLQSEKVDQTWHAIAPAIASRLQTMLAIHGAENNPRLQIVPDRPLIDPPPVKQLAMDDELSAILASQSKWLEPTSTMVASREEGFAPRLATSKAQFPPALWETLCQQSPKETPAAVLMTEFANAGLLLALADVALRTDQAALAGTLYERVWKESKVQAHPSQVLYAARRAGETLVAQNEFEHANKHFTQLARTKNRADRAAILLALAKLQGLQLGKPAESFALLQELIAQYPNAKEQAEAQYLMIKALLVRRQWEDAIAAGNKLLREYPNHPWAQEVRDILMPLAANRGVRKSISQAPAPVASSDGTTVLPKTKKGLPPQFIP